MATRSGKQQQPKPEAPVEVVEEATPVEAPAPAPEVDQETPASDAPGEGDAGEEGETAARAAALARLVNPDAHEAEGDDEDTPGGGERVPALPERTGVVREWGGDVPHLVVGVLFQHKVGQLTRTAYKGDVIKVVPAEVVHGVDARIIAPLPG